MSESVTRLYDEEVLSDELPGCGVGGCGRQMLGGTSEFRDDFILLRTGQLPLQSYALTEIGAGEHRPRLFFQGKRLPAGAQRPSCSPKTRRGGSRSILPSYRSFCASLSHLVPLGPV